VRCLGADCLTVTPEQSGDFARAAAALQAAQMAASDMDCTGGSCVVFAGEAMECRKAVGGIVNCCTTPDGISLADYLSLVFAVGKIDNALMGLAKGNALRGSWETLRDPVVSTWDAVTDRFTSVANNLMGKTAADVSDAAAELSLDGFKQALLRETAAWGANVFGETAANALFSVNGGAAFIGGSLQTGPIQLGGLVGTALSWVMTAYMLYTVAVILVQLIWTCEQEELELGAKRELRSCHDVGSYCRSKVLTACIERRNSYCCFPARPNTQRADPPAAWARLGRGGQPRLHGACGRGPRAGRLEPGEPGRVARDPRGDRALSEPRESQPRRLDRCWKRVPRRGHAGECGGAKRDPVPGARQ
jgi:conjugal transfer mating pair stabilization protein TraN